MIRARIRPERQANTCGDFCSAPDADQRQSLPGNLDRHGFDQDAVVVNFEKMRRVERAFIVAACRDT